MQNVKLNYFNFENNIFQIINKYCFTKHENTYGVAVSGGPDSMLLLHVLHNWASLKNKVLHVFCFNHNLRPESSIEALLVSKACRKLGCKFIEIKWNKKPQSAVMEQARIARYSKIALLCKSHNIKTLFLGHHADDIAETVSMRILKSSNLDGLCPIFELREIFDIKLLRPFLNIKKEQILKFNKIKSINYVNDFSNSNDKYFRSRIRKILKTDIELKENIIKASFLFCKIRKLSNELIKNKLSEYFSYEREGFLIVDRHILLKFPKFLILSLFKTSICRIANKNYFSNAPLLERIYVKALKNCNLIYSICGCILVFNKKKIYIFRELNDIFKNYQIIDNNSKLIWDNRFELYNKTGQNIKILPLGKVLNNKFFKKEFQLNKKKLKILPFFARKSLPAIFTLEGLMYIPHLNISETKLLKRNIDCRTIDFFNKKYDNIL